MEREGERDEFAFCTQQHDDGGARRATLVSRLSFELSSPDAAFACLFVQQQQVYKLILDRPLSIFIIPCVISAWDMSYVRTAWATFI